MAMNIESCSKRSCLKSIQVYLRCVIFYFWRYVFWKFKLHLSLKQLTDKLSFFLSMHKEWEVGENAQRYLHTIDISVCRMKRSLNIVFTCVTYCVTIQEGRKTKCRTKKKFSWIGTWQYLNRYLLKKYWRIVEVQVLSLEEAKALE